MTQIHSKLIFAFSILLSTTTIRVGAMEPEDTAPYNSVKESQAARARWERIQERAQENVKRYDRAKEELANTQLQVEQIVQDGKVDATLKTHEQIMQEAEETLRAGQEFLARVAAAKKDKKSEAPITILPINALNNALDENLELSTELNNFFKPNTPSDEEILAQSFGPETALPYAAATALPVTPAEISAPVVAAPALPARPATPDQSSPRPRPTSTPEERNTLPVPHHIDESFVASVLNNLLGVKAPVVTAGTLGLVHYLYENQVFNQAVAVRSPKMKAFLHDYVLPTAREALGAHLIQLIIPHLPYLRDKGIRSFSTSNYLASFLATKMLGSTTIYFAKMLTESEQGKKLVTHYKRLPKKTKETIAKVLPWLDFARNMFMARSLASYFDPVYVNPGVQLG